MLVSSNWLQTYFNEQLPSPEKIRDAFTFHAFEIEGVEQRKNSDGKTDTIFDVKVLPDRNHYALSHRGMAYELSAILNTHRTISAKKANNESNSHEVQPLYISVEAPELCMRYIGRRIENVSVTESPQWLKERLESVGSRSINFVVDATNFVMLDMGQPLHAFDADLVEGNIVVRFSKEAEKIVILDGREISLESNMLVIADDVGPLAIAGIKGGKRAEVTLNTKNIILEAATFSASSVRKTSLKVGIRNDSSKRFENAITPVFAEIGMSEATALIQSFSPDVYIGAAVDIYSEPQGETLIEVAPDYISAVLGVEIQKEEIKQILKRLEIECDESSESIAGAESELGKGAEDSVFFCHIPAERLDLALAQDIVEEVGRLYGYDKIESKPLQAVEKPADINQYFYYTEKIKDFLGARDFSEVSTYTLSSKGDFEIEKSASDKKFVRTNLTDGIVGSLELNLHNAPLLGLDQIKIFEIGKTFKKTGEELSLAIGIANAKTWKGQKESAANEEIKRVRDELFQELGANVTIVCTVDDTGGILLLGKKEIGMTNNSEGLTEFNLGAMIDSLPKPERQAQFNAPLVDVLYQSISSYPFVLRDIAVFVPGEGGRENEVLEMIHQTAGELLVRETLFDIFTKRPKEGTEGEIKTSYAFRLVFQSLGRTLTDEEINEVMQKVADKLNSNKGWQVR